MQSTTAAPKPERDASLDIAFIRDNAAPIQGTAAQRYLEGRGLIIPPDADLLFHPDLTHYETRTGYPAMIGLIRNVAGEVVALHRTYLAEQPDKVTKAAIAKPRMMIGKTAGGTVRLGAITAQGLLGLCEGIETGLAVMHACPTLPVWAALSTSGMEQAQLPPEARRIVILADHDPSGAGLRAAEATAAKLQLEGREVRIAMPTTPGTDCLTLCQAWASAGRPPAARSLGSFETWSQTLGGILHVAGVPGFLGNLDEVMEALDSEGGSWRAFIQLWWDRFGSAEVSVSDLIGFARDAEASLPISAKNDHGLKVALGAAFTKLRDRAFRTSDRLVHLRQGKLLHNSQRWRLVPAQEVPDHGGLGGLMGVSDVKTPIAGSQEIRGFDGSWGSWGSTSIPYTRAHTRINKREVEKDPQDPQDPQSVENSDGYEWGSSEERPPQTPKDPHWLEGVP